jgi:AcrR family transcriptional regulator
MHAIAEAAATLGLRDRKRRETRERLERAAVGIALDEGLDHLTIDAISERANVSPRTFFNYFDSKEDAILGLQITEDTKLVISKAVEKIHPASLLDGVMQLLLYLVGNAIHDAELHEQRRQLIRRYPELLHRHFSQTIRMLGTLTSAVQTLMARVEPDGEGAACSDAHAQVVLMTCGAAVRSAMAELMSKRTAIPAENFTTMVGRRATTLVREAINTLQ